MIDNLKYSGNTTSTGLTIQNYDGYQGKPITDGVTVSDGSAGTTGMFYRYGRGSNVPSSGTGTRNTIDGSSDQSDINSNKAFYNNPMRHAACYGGIASGYIAANTMTHCGYLYNWFAATGGTGLASMVTSGAQATGNICPANFRLPSATSGVGGPTSNGTSSTVADLPVLNASMNAGTLATGDTTNTFYANWFPTGPWSGTFSGRYNNNLEATGTDGDFWSSTVGSATAARNLSFEGTTVNPGIDISSSYYGFAVRCVMP